jgi:glycosyltransferase involved in cell wall biosynthesis
MYTMRSFPGGWNGRGKKRRLPLVSVITPVFNASETLTETIESVINHSYGNIEFILVDGLSTDGTVEIIQNAARRHRMIRWIGEKDNGAYDAMNKGLEMSKGDWVYFLGADDTLYNESVFRELFDEGYLSQDRVFYGNVIIDGETAWAKDQEVYAGEFDLPKFLKRNICHQAVFYPRHVVKKAGFFNTDYIVCSDWDYNMRCYAMQPFIYVDKIIARFRGGGLSSVKKETVFGKEFPGNIIRYFGLDPDDPELVKPGSVFRSVVMTYRKLRDG